MKRSHRSLVVAAATACIVTAANASQGAYFSQSWGWIALAFLIPTTLVLILDRASVPGVLRIAFATLMLILGAWILLSSVWSLSAPGSIRESERMLVYVAVALAVAIVLRRGDGTGVLAGVVIGTTVICTYGLATRLFPDILTTTDDPLFEHRLAQPLGSPNGLGVLAAIGVLIALGFVAHGRSLMTPVLAALAITPQIAALYFTFSRGAWTALAVSFAAAVALDPRWLRTLWSTSVTALPSIAALAFLSRQHALTTKDAAIATETRAGHHAALALCALAACSALFAWAAYRTGHRMTMSESARRVANVVAFAAVFGILLLTVAAVGGPARGVSEIKARFVTEPAVDPVDLNGRLFSISGSGRAEIWHVAWDGARDAPLLGNGAGSFEYVWYEKRPSLTVVRDAHSLYLETLGETGVVGLGLLAAVLFLPVIAAVKARRTRFIPFGIAAYLAWAIASAVDWHWELVALTTTALLAGGAALLAAEGPNPRALEHKWRAVVLVISVAFSVVALVSLVGNQALFAGKDDIARGDWTGARANANRARALLIWSFEPDLVLGDAAAGLGDRSAAVRAYRNAVGMDSRNWVAWLRLAQVARGAERKMAYAKVHELNPRDRVLPGEGTAGG